MILGSEKKPVQRSVDYDIFSLAASEMLRATDGLQKFNPRSAAGRSARPQDFGDVLVDHLPGLLFGV